MFGGVKITLILCLTIVVSCILFISYNEYTNRYSLLTTNDNSLYIFDKKSTVLNKCDGKSCSTIETKLPTRTAANFDPSFQQSKMFDSNRPMTNEVVNKIPENNSNIVEAKPKEQKEQPEVKAEEKQVENAQQAGTPENKDEKQPAEKEKNENTALAEPQKVQANVEKTEDEFVE